MSTSISGSDRLDAEERRERLTVRSEFPKHMNSQCPTPHMCGRRKFTSDTLRKIKSLNLPGIFWRKPVNTVSMSKVKRSFPGPGTNSSRKPFPRPRDALAPPKLSAQAVASLLRLLF